MLFWLSFLSLGPLKDEESFQFLSFEGKLSAWRNSTSGKLNEKFPSRWDFNPVERCSSVPRELKVYCSDSFLAALCVMLWVRREIWIEQHLWRRETREGNLRSFWSSKLVALQAKFKAEKLFLKPESPTKCFVGTSNELHHQARPHKTSSLSHVGLIKNQIRSSTFPINYAFSATSRNRWRAGFNDAR